MKITQSLQDKLEDIFKAQKFTVRYERGNFKSGYCIIEQESVIVINKFFPLESKVNSLIEILRQLEIDETTLDAAQLKFVKKLKLSDPGLTAGPEVSTDPEVSTEPEL